jgi:hypothetical protein
VAWETDRDQSATPHPTPTQPAAHLDSADQSWAAPHCLPSIDGAWPWDYLIIIAPARLPALLALRLPPTDDQGPEKQQNHGSRQPRQPGPNDPQRDQTSQAEITVRTSRSLSCRHCGASYQAPARSDRDRPRQHPERRVPGENQDRGHGDDRRRSCAVRVAWRLAGEHALDHAVNTAAQLVLTSTPPSSPHTAAAVDHHRRPADCSCT